MSVYNNYKYELPTSGEFYNTLKNTIAPNFAFTQSTLYSALSQVYLFLDAVPTLNENNVLGIEYFNNINDTLTYTDEISDKTTTLSSDRYVNGLITDYQKGDLDRSIVYPCSNGFAKTQVISVGIPSSNDYVMKVDYPIREIEKVEIIIGNIEIKKLSRQDKPAVKKDFLKLQNVVVDITPYVYEYSQYLLLEKPTDNFIDSGHIAANQKNTFYYKQGSNQIFIGNIVPNEINQQYFSISAVLESSFRRYFGIPNSSGLSFDYFEYPLENISPTTPYQVKYRITYKPILNGRLKIESNENKYQGEERLDQNSGSVDLNRIGSNLFGTAIKIGNESLNVINKLSTYENRPKKGMVYTDSDNSKWLIDTVNTTFFNGYCVSEVSLTKNFNKLNNFIRLNQDKRFNEIDTRLTTKSEDTYVEYLYFGLNNNFVATPIHLKEKVILNGITSTFDYASEKTSVNFATCLCFNEDRSGTLQNNEGDTYLPLVSYGVGNALCFEMQYESPIAVGTKLNVIPEFFTTSYYGIYVLYSDNEGFADIFDIKLYESNDNIASSFANDFPIIKSDTTDNATLLGSFDHLHYYKKSNEIFALNYELICLPYGNNEIYFGEKFIKNNGIINNALLNATTNLYVSTSKRYNILDKSCVGTLAKTNVQFITTYNNLNGYTADLSLEIKNYKTSLDIVSWALCDKDNNILIAVNNSLVANSPIKLYIKSSHTRL